VSRTWASGDLHVAVSEGIATVTLDRPSARNALTLAMWRALPDLARELEDDSDVRVVLVRGGGDRAFSGGADISEFPEVYATPAAARAYNDTVRTGLDAIARVRKPVIAMVFGACVGGGCGLAMSCDLRFAAEGAKFAIPPARLGAAYSFGDVKQLVELIGPARAKDILFSGRQVGASEARDIGLADRVVADTDLETETDVYARELAKLSLTSIHAMKWTVQAVCNGSDAESEELRRLFDETFASEDFAEGYRAFLEKRRPSFR